MINQAPYIDEAIQSSGPYSSTAKIYTTDICLYIRQPCLKPQLKDGYQFKYGHFKKREVPIYNEKIFRRSQAVFQTKYNCVTYNMEMLHPAKWILNMLSFLLLKKEQIGRDSEVPAQLARVVSAREGTAKGN